MEQLATNDCWARDIAPLFVHDRHEEIAIDLRFNSWGGKFRPYDDDAAFAQRLAGSIGIRSMKAGFVGEGGAIEVDGEGTAIVVEPSILNKNRNPGATRAQVEDALNDLLGVSAVIWLPHGLLDDIDTDGHVDNVARFVRPSEVVCQTAGRDDEDSSRLRENLEVLRRARDAAGRQLTIIEMPWLPYSDLGDGRPASYCNFYFVNRGLIVPLVGAQSDNHAVDLLAQATGRTPVGLSARAMAHGRGGVHCVVMPRFHRHSPDSTTRS